MPKRVQRLRHATAAANVFTGLDGEITIDSTNKAIRIHDNFTPGGFEAARRDLNNVPAAIGGSQDGKMTSSQATELANATANNVLQDTRLDVIDTPILTTGTGSAYVLTLGITALIVDRVYIAHIHTDSLAGGVTLAIDGTGIQNVYDNDDIAEIVPLIAGELKAFSIAKFLWDGNNFHLLNPEPRKGFITSTMETTGAGTITLSNGLLDYYVFDRICRLKSRNAILINSITGPITGDVYINLATLPFTADLGMRNLISFTDLAVAPDKGIIAFMTQQSGNDVIQLQNQLGTGLPVSIVSLIQNGSSFYIDISFKVS